MALHSLNSMKRRFTVFLLLALSLVALAGLAACGGDDDDASNGDTAETPGADETTATTEPAETPTPRPIRTPTPVPAGEPVLLVVFEGTEFFPNEEQFRALPQATITADGTEYSGVTLGTIAAQVQAPAETTVSVEGINTTGERYAIARFLLGEVAETSILVLGENGRVDLVSSSIEPAQWMTAVNSVSFP
jgi:hypothetical protein